MLSSSMEHNGDSLDALQFPAKNYMLQKTDWQLNDNFN